MLRFFTLLLISAALCIPADIPNAGWLAPKPDSSPTYYWVKTPVEGGAQILTLFGHFGDADFSQSDIPLVSVLRDSLPDGSAETDRLRSVWLLTEKQPRFGQRILSAVPFFYWSVGSKSKPRAVEMPTQLVDLSSPTPRVWKTISRDIVQWTILDPLTMPVRASTRAYRTNGLERERLHVEEALLFLRSAPTSSKGDGLSETELNSVIARLELTKSLLGGLVTEKQLLRVSENRDASFAETVGRNWELLRTSAERSGLLFEPLRLTNSGEEYAVLWFPVNTNFSAPGLAMQPTWKLLHISDPWADSRLKDWRGYTEKRSLDERGALLPAGATGARQVELIPLAAYSLTYPRAPLLLVNFRNNLAPKRKELAQRTSDEIVSGILGLSHFTNWYYYAGNSAYEFVKARRGSAEDRAERLDSYSQFRVASALNTSLDPKFRQELQRRSESLAINPLETSPVDDVAWAQHHFKALQLAAANEKELPKQLDRNRRKELSEFGRGYSAKALRTALHFLSFGAYTSEASQGDQDLDYLLRNRQIEAKIAYLDMVADSGPRPEVTFPVERIHAAVTELTSLISSGVPSSVRRKATLVITRVQAQSQDMAVLDDCRWALASLNAPAGHTNGAAGKTAAQEASTTIDTMRPNGTK